MAFSILSSSSRYFRPKPPSLEIGKELSRGAYGAVHSGRLDGKEVAVKRIHGLLEAAREQGDLETMLGDFRHECELLEQVDHPHVVKFKGAFYDETIDEPILVMELMTENLRQYLERNRGQLSRQKQLEICISIVRGLFFLHTQTPPIVHRDLTDKNILLDANGVVKISDLGQSRLKTADYFSTGQPGAIPFMSPEAMPELSHYNEKLDMFSLGVLMLEVATQQSPRVRLVGIGITPELQRRSEDLSKLDEDHPLQPLILSCLKDNPKERPDILTIHTQLLAMVDGIKLQTVQSTASRPTQEVGSPASGSEQQEEVVQLKQEVNTSELSKEELSSSAKMREYRMVKMEHADPPHQEKEMEREGEVCSEPPCPGSTPYLAPQLPPFFPPPNLYTYSGPSLEVVPPTPLSSPTMEMGPWTAMQPLVFQTSQLLENRPTLHSVRQPGLPIATSFATAVVIARSVYVCGGFCSDPTSSRVVQVYDIDKETWTTLPPAPQYQNEAVAINNQLVLIGGADASSNIISNMVSTWTGQCWQKNLPWPAMPTKRCKCGVTSYNTYVIVAGGADEDNQTLLCSIDVLDTTTREWRTLVNLQLPRPMYRNQITLSDTHICVASAGIAYDASTNTGTSSKRVWQLSVSTLTKVLANEDSSPHDWEEIAPTSNYQPALLQHTANPLAVGGHNNSFKPTCKIVVYDSRHNQWVTVGQLLEPRAGCTVVGLSRHSFLVCGGLSNVREVNSRLTSVEVVSVL